MTTTVPRAIQMGTRRVPVVLPNRRDPRLHTAAVIISVHTIGIIWLGFEVSIPQIVVAILTAALIDVGFTFARTRSLVWPASGMLTGSGVALILRYVPTSSGEYWSWAGWYWFAAIAGASVLSKYLIRWKGNHVFNPSNLGLVVAFLIVGREVIEPLDFWWAPLGVPMIVAYALIVGGGVAITRRLQLLEMAVVFWTVLVAGLGVLAASGHCMVATWSATPVCDGRFWTALATSPEILVFLFFMITDPKTIPLGRAGRVAFAATLAVAATLLIAPQSLEYGAKVALLGSLVLWSPLRWGFDRLFGTESGVSGLSALVGMTRGAGSRPLPEFGRGLTIGALLAVIGVSIVIAGGPARTPAVAAPPPVGEIPANLETGVLPPITVDDTVERVISGIDSETAESIAAMLLENLALETEAVRSVDANLLALADGGERLTEMQARINDVVTNGIGLTDTYRFDSLAIRPAGEAEGQTSAALALDGTGTMETISFDSAGNEIDRSTRSFATIFTMRQLAGERWLIVRVMEG